MVYNIWKYRKLFKLTPEQFREIDAFDFQQDMEIWETESIYSQWREGEDN